MFGLRSAGNLTLSPDAIGFDTLEAQLYGRYHKIFLRLTGIISTAHPRYYYQVGSREHGGTKGLALRNQSGLLSFFCPFKAKTDLGQRPYNGLRSKNSWQEVHFTNKEVNTRYEAQSLDRSGDWWFPNQIYPRQPRQRTPTASINNDTLDNLVALASPGPILTPNQQSQHIKEELEDLLDSTSQSILVDFTTDSSNTSLEHAHSSFSSSSNNFINIVTVDTSNGHSANNFPDFSVNCNNNLQDHSVSTFRDTSVNILQEQATSQGQPTVADDMDNTLAAMLAGIPGLQDFILQYPRVPQGPTGGQQPQQQQPDLDPITASRRGDMGASVVQDGRIVKMGVILSRIEHLKAAIIHNVLGRQEGQHAFTISARPIQSPSLDHFPPGVSTELNEILTDAVRRCSDIIIKAQFEAYQKLCLERDELAQDWERSTEENRSITAIANRRPPPAPRVIPEGDPEAATTFYLPPSDTSRTISVNPVVSRLQTTGSRIAGTRSHSRSRPRNRRGGGGNNFQQRARSDSARRPDNANNPEVQRRNEQLLANARAGNPLRPQPQQHHRGQSERNNS